MSSFTRTTNQIADQFKDSASSARSSLADFGSTAMRLLDSARDREIGAVDYALDRMGLQRRQSALRPALFFAAGAVVAGAAALLLAPTTGKRFRMQILDFLGAAPNELEKRIDAALSDAKPSTRIATGTAPEKADKESVISASDKPANNVFDRSPRGVPTPHQS